MEEILKIAELKNKIKELERKRALNLDENERYAERKEKEIDGLERELRKSNKEKEFMRYTTNDEHDQFISNAYDQTFTQNIQLRDWLNTTTSNLHEKRREVQAAKQQFENYKKQAVEDQALLVDAKQKIALENEQLRRQIAEALRLQQADEVGPIVGSCLDGKMEKESSLKRKRKSSKKNGKKKLKRKHHDKKKDKSLTKNVRINASDSGLDEKMTPGNQ